MKILFVTEYFYPYIHGGAEISIYQLAKKLKAVVLTPNYGSVKYETIGGTKVIRFFWPIHLHKFSSQLSPAYYANPITWLYLAFVIIWQNQKIGAEIFHSQSVNSFPAVWLAAKLLRKKCVVNIRDNQILCNYGWCLSNNKIKACSLKEYFLEDFRHYYRDKVKPKNMYTLSLNLIFAILGRLRILILKFFINKADEKICASYIQQKTLTLNGISAKTIYNIFEFPKLVLENKSKNEVLYATKLSEGKGLGLLLHSWVNVNKKFPNFKLKVVGDGDQKFYKSLVNKLKIAKSVTFQRMPDFKEIREIRQEALLEVTPSIYPESFGRAALEAIALGVPVVTSNRGGLKEIAEDGVTGYVVEPDKKQLASAIIKAIENNDQLRQNISSRYLILKNKFEIKPVKQYIDLYKNLL